LVIDALDGSRGDPTGSALLAVMQAVMQRNDQWHVAASIRKYDLRYSPVLRELFLLQGTTAISAEFQDAEFAIERHINVPLFTDAELAAIREQAPSLDQLLESAPAALHGLLRVPFSLRLMANIVESGVNLADLRPIRTQGELLRRFWPYRVLHASNADLRERVVQQACRLMVTDRRLRVDRQKIVEPGSVSALVALLSGQVLMEWQATSVGAPNRQIISFAQEFDAKAVLLQSHLDYTQAHDEITHAMGRTPE